MRRYANLPESSEKDRAMKNAVARKLLQEYSKRNFAYRMVEGISLLYPSVTLVSYSLQTQGNHTIPISIASILAVGGIYRLLFKDQPEKLFEASQVEQGSGRISQINFHVIPLSSFQDSGLVVSASLSFQ